jgi:prophage regulatory protein
MEKLLMKPMEVAQILGIGRSLVYEMLATKELPSIRIGRCIRIPANALEKWIQDKQAVIEK